METVPSIDIYEEDDLMRALLKEWLSQAGYRVRDAGPRGARGEDTGDLAIVSVYMPKQAGLQLREIQAAHPRMPLIAISGQFRSGLPVAGMAARMLGVERVLAKPLERCDLLEAVRSVIGRSD
jgi:DNA-binding response OmpR family regulator